jgi:hypothetical protein
MRVEQANASDRAMTIVNWRIVSFRAPVGYMSCDGWDTHRTPVARINQSYEVLELAGHC